MPGMIKTIPRGQNTLRFMVLMGAGSAQKYRKVTHVDRRLTRAESVRETRLGSGVSDLC